MAGLRYGPVSGWSRPPTRPREFTAGPLTRTGLLTARAVRARRPGSRVCPAPRVCYLAADRAAALSEFTAAPDRARESAGLAALPAAARQPSVAGAERLLPDRRLSEFTAGP
ncbi:hypothetical protein [Streptomyces sp. NPDC048720]|uniref:hypothetical protein n=1 Tax=Streptomyces sp. NPDC048720 TaxID=3365588 RepID=UPI0037154F17